MNETIKERMKRIRLRAGYKSQSAAANAIGCDRGNVGMWEAPSSAVKSVGHDWLFQVARAYLEAYTLGVLATWTKENPADKDGGAQHEQTE